MSDDIGVKMESSGADGIERLITSIDKLDTSMAKLGSRNSDMVKLRAEMQAMQNATATSLQEVAKSIMVLQQTMVMGFTEMVTQSANAQSKMLVNQKKADEQQASELEKHLNKLIFTSNAANAKIEAGRDAADARRAAKAGEASMKALEVELAAENLRAKTLQALIEKRDMDEYSIRSSASTALQALIEKRDTEEYTIRSSASKALQALIEKRDLDEYSIRSASAAKLQGLVEKRDLEEYHEREAAGARLKALTEKQEVDLYMLREAAAEKQRRLNTNYTTSTLQAQLNTAQQAQVYSSLGGNATERYGSSAAAANLAELRRQLDAMPSAANRSREAISAHNLAMQEGHALARGLAGSLGGLWLTYGSLVPLAAGAAIAGSLKSIVSVGKEVEYQLKFVEALSNEKVDLNKFLSVTDGTIVSVRDAAEGMRALAQSGLNAQQSLQALPTILNLSVIGEMSIGSAALAATGAVNAFGLSLDNIGHVGDVFAQVAAQSNTSVALLTESMKQASTVAQVYNVSLEEVGSALGVFAKQNITGSAAGTAFTNMLTGLYSPTKQAGEALKRLGVDTTDGSGGLKNSTQLIKELRVALSQLNDSARADVLNDIFTNRGVKAFAAISENIGLYIDGIDKAQNATGMMSKAVMTLEDSTEAAFKRLRNNTSGTLARVFNETSPAVQELVQQLANLARSDAAVNILTHLANAASSGISFLVEHAKAVALIAGSYALLTPARAILTAVAGGFQFLMTAETAATASTLTFGVAVRGVMATLGPIALALTLAVAAWGALTAATDKQEAADLRLRNSMESNIDFLTRETEAINKRNDALDKATGAKVEPAKTAGQQLQEGLEARLAKARRDQLASGDETVKQQMARAGDIERLEAALQVAKRQRFDEEAAMAANRMATLGEQARIEKKTILDQIQAFQERAATMKLIDGKEIKVDPLGNVASQAIANSQKLKDVVQGVKDGTISATQAKIELTAAEREYNAVLGAAPKEETKADRDIIAATIAELESSKQLLAIENQLASLKDKAANRAGTLDDLSLMDNEYKRERDLLSVTLAKTEAQKAAVATLENKRAAEQKYDNQIMAAELKLSELDDKAATEKSSYFDKFNKDNLRLLADSLEKQGDLVGAFNKRYEAENGSALARVTAAYAKTQADLAALPDDPLSDPAKTVLLAQRNDALKQYLANMQSISDQGQAGARYKEVKTQIDTMLADLQDQLSRAKAQGDEDGGLSGALGLAETATRLRRDVLPQITDLQEKLNNISRASGLPDLMKQAGESSRGIGKEMVQLSKAAQPFGNEWTNAWKDIESAAHSAWMNIGQEGESIFKSIGKVIKTSILEMLYQMTIKKWIISIGATISDVAGGGSAGALGSGGSALSTLQMAYKLYNSASTGFSSFGASTAGALGSGVQGLGTFFGSSGMASYGAGMSSAVAGSGDAAMYASAQTAGNLAPGAVAGNAAGAGMAGAASIAAGAAGGILGGNAISSGYSAIGSNSTNATAVGTAIGAYIGTAIIPGLGTALGSLVGGLIGGVVNRAFGHKAPEIESQGIRGSLSSAGATGDSYQNIVEKGGWFTSDKHSSSSQTLTSEFQNSLTSGFTSLKTITSGFVTTLGLSATALKDYTKTFDVKLDPKDAAKSQEALTKLFTDIGDEMATQLVPGLATFQKVGESASATLQRLAGDFQVTSSIAQLLGKTAADAFGAAGMTSVAAREQFVNMSGGLDALASKVSAYAQNYLTEQERAAPVISALNDEFARLGVAAPKTRDDFKSLVSGLDLTKASDVGLFNSLMGLQDAFASVTAETTKLTAVLSPNELVSAYASAGKAVQDRLRSVSDIIKGFADDLASAAGGVTAAQSDISQAYFSAQDGVAAAQQKIVDLNNQAAQATLAFGASVKTYLMSLGTGSLGSATSASALVELKAQFASTSNLAQGGNVDARGSLIGVSGQLIESLKVNSRNSTEFAIGEARVKAVLNAISHGIDAKAATDKPALDPMVAAQAELLAAQNKLTEYAALAYVTGASTDRASQITAGSTKALLDAYNNSTAVEDKARADYAVAIGMTSNLALTSTTTMDGLREALRTLADSQAEFIKSRDDLATFIINTETSSGNLDKFAASLASSLGLTGMAAETLKLALAAPGTAAGTLADYLGAGAIKIGNETAALQASFAAQGVATAALSTAMSAGATSVVTATDLLSFSIGDTQGSLASVVTALTGTGTVAGQLADLLGPSVLGTAATSAATNLGLLGSATQSLVGMINAFLLATPIASGMTPALPTTGPVELSAEQKFIAGLYNDILGRIPDAAGLNYWANALGAGVINLTNAATMIATSAATANLDPTASHAAGWSSTVAAADAAGSTSWLRAHNVPGFAVGTNFVPNDMLAQIHEGERIVPAADNRELMVSMRRGAGGDNSELVAEIKLLRLQVARLEVAANKAATHGAETSTNTREAKDALYAVIAGKETFKVEVEVEVEPT